MLRRLPRSATALDQKQEELRRAESELRDQVQKLERMIAEVPRLAEEVERRQREELLMRANEGRDRLDVSVALQDKRYGEDVPPPKRGSLRKERREGRIVFLVLVIALVAVVIWLLGRLHF